MNRIGNDTYIDGDIQIEGRYKSLLADGGASPVQVLSKVLNPNLNADYLDGFHGSYYLDFANATNKQLVSDQLLTGWSLGSNVAITAADSIKQAFGKVQAQINSLGTISHAAVTLGTPNGLSLAPGQILSMGLASAVATGALSSTDFNTFSAKLGPGVYTADANAIAGTGFYHSDNLTTNVPVAYSVIIEAKRATDRRGQIAIESIGTTGRMWVRSQGLGGVYSAWNEVITTGNQATLTRGTGLTGGNYLPNTAATWAFDTTWGDARYSLAAHTHTFASLTSKPTTISGYGITDLLTQTLTGYTTGSNTVITSGHTILNAFRDVQAQITTLGTSSHAALTIGTANGLSLAGQALSLQLATGSVPGALSAADWTTFNAKQAALSGTGIVKSTGGTISYITDNSSNWNTAFSWGNHSGLYFPAIVAVSDLQAVTGNRLFNSSIATPSNGLGSSEYGGGLQIVAGGNPDYANQLLFAATGALFTRTKFATVWGGLDRVITTGNQATLTRGTGLTGSNYQPYSAATFAVDFGSGTNQAARGDHNHTGVYAPASHTLDSHSNVTITSVATNQLIRWSGSAWVNWTPTFGAGSVTSVAMTLPTGLSIAGSPITTSGTLAVTYAAGYAIPTTAKQTQWDAAYAHIGTGGSSHANATTSVAGFMSATDKTNWDAVYAVSSDYIRRSIAETITANKTFTGIAFFPGPEVTDMNAPVGTRFVRSSSSPTNSGGGSYTTGVQFSAADNNDYANQLMFDYLGPLRIRTKNAGAWGSWDRVTTASMHATLTRGTGLTGSNYTPTGSATFAVAYGTSSGTATEGNDSRVNNGQTAFGWGNHAGLYVPLARTVSAGTGLSGGGALSSNITLSLASGVVSPGSYYNVTVDTYGRVTGGSNPTTLAGFGILDAANASHTHTFASLTSKPTDLAGYGITDGITGSGLTTNYLTKWNGSQLALARITDSGSGRVYVTVGLQTGGDILAGGDIDCGVNTFYGNKVATNVAEFANTIVVGGSSISSGLAFEVRGTTKASRPFPKMTRAQRLALSPSEGDFVFQTEIVGASARGVKYYDGATWQHLDFNTGAA